MSIFYFSFLFGGFFWYFGAFQFLLKFRGIIRSMSSKMSPVALRHQCVAMHFNVVSGQRGASFNIFIYS